MVVLVRSRLILGGGGGDGTTAEEGEVRGWGGGTAEGTNPLYGSFYGNCREWLANHTTLIVCIMGNHYDV